MLFGVQAIAASGKPTLLRAIQYGKAGSTALQMDIAMPVPEPTTRVPAIVSIHGGGWQGGSRNDGMWLAQDCAKDGFITAAIDYRLTQQAPFPAQLQDCKCAIRFLRANAKKYHIDPTRIGVWGASAGGHLVAMLGLTEGIAEFEGDGGWNNASSRVQAVCDWFGPTDLAAWVRTEQRFGGDSGLCKLLGFQWDKPELAQWGRTLNDDAGLSRLLGRKPLDNPKRASWASPISYVQKSVNTPPFLIMQGDQDCWVPYQQSIQLADALDKKGVDVTLRILLNSGHGSNHFATAWRDHVKSFFDRALAAVRQAVPSP
jgi:acetyl esterase/lipase